MSIDHIPRLEWASFCETFSRLHHGWLMDVEASPPPDRQSASAPSGLEAQVQEHDHLGQATSEQETATATMQLQGILPDTILDNIALTPSPGREEQVVITAESREGKVQTHAVQQPTGIRLEHTDSGADEALYIDTPSHTVILRFPVTAPMEALDGFTAE